MSDLEDPSRAREPGLPRARFTMNHLCSSKCGTRTPATLMAAHQRQPCQTPLLMTSSPAPRLFHPLAASQQLAFLLSTKSQTAAAATPVGNGEQAKTHEGYRLILYSKPDCPLCDGLKVGGVGGR